MSGVAAASVICPMCERRSNKTVYTTLEELHSHLVKRHLQKRRTKKTLLERFEERYVPVPESGCWLWINNVGETGYGILSDNRVKYLAHRWSYEHFKGPIPEGLVIDHICRVRSCVNPNHLRAVTQHINAIENSTSPSAENAAKTHCKNGHPLIGRNLGIVNKYTYVKNRRVRPHRYCKTCTKIAWEKANKKRMEKRAALRSSINIA